MGREGGASPGDASKSIATLLCAEVADQARVEPRFDLEPNPECRPCEVLRTVCEANGGTVFRADKGALYATFAVPPAAVKAALEGQLALIDTFGESASRSVRMALHLGEVHFENGQRSSPTVQRCIELMHAAHEGQVLISDVVAALLRDRLPEAARLADLGEHRLGDLSRPGRVFQLVHPALPVDHPPPRTLDALPNNLPVQLTSFVGRERETTAITRLLSRGRLITLTGTGGCGKTRLALRVATDVLQHYPDGVWLVELAPLSDPELMPQAVALALGVSAQSGRPLVSSLIEFLQHKHLLIVLDNCEHLIDACGWLAQALLKACPLVQILATSRQLLDVEGEHAWRVPSLSIPEAGHVVTVDRAMRYEAVELFVERAANASPTFVLSTDNAPAVGQLCLHLDGNPLAIELASARLRAISVQQLVARLEDRFRLLSTASHSGLARHVSLRTLIDWSYDLLDDTERWLFARLSVFAGGWTLEAAEAVCSGDGIEVADVIDLVSELVDKSLVTVDMVQRSDQVRYHFLETLRAYANEKLVADGQARMWRLRHLGWCLALANRADTMLRGPDQQEWLNRLEREHDNLREALSFAADGGDDTELVEQGLELAGALRWFWWNQGYYRERQEQLTRLLTLPGAAGRTVARARALDVVGYLAAGRGDTTAAYAFHTESLAICRELGYTDGIAWALTYLGVAAFRQGDGTTARTHVEESLGLFRKLGNRDGAAWALCYLGLVEMNAGNQTASVAALQESLTIYRALNDREHIARALLGLGMQALYGDPVDPQAHATAAASFREALELFAAAGLRHAYNLPYVLEGLGGVAAAEGHAARALRLAGAAATQRNMSESIAAVVIQPNIARSLAPARQALGEAGAEAAFAEGLTMTLDEAIDYALAAEPDAVTGKPEGVPPALASRWAPLTQREQQVATLITRGYTNREIARELVITTKTAGIHVEHILAKLGVRSRTQVATWVLERGLLIPSDDVR